MKGTEFTAAVFNEVGVTALVVISYSNNTIKMFPVCLWFNSKLQRSLYCT